MDKQLSQGPSLYPHFHTWNHQIGNYFYFNLCVASAVDATALSTVAVLLKNYYFNFRQTVWFFDEFCLSCKLEDECLENSMQSLGICSSFSFNEVGWLRACLCGKQKTTEFKEVGWQCWHQVVWTVPTVLMVKPASWEFRFLLETVLPFLSPLDIL